VIRTMEQKLALLAKNPAEVFVVTHRNNDGTVEYTATLSNPEGICQVTCMYDNWFEATWYESQDEAESKIADSVRNIYSVECILISRESLELGVTVTKEPPKAHFKCACGCEFSARPETCKTTHSDLEGGYECSDLRIK